MTLTVVACKDRQRTAPIQEVSKNIEIPAFPNSVNIEGKQKEVLMDFFRVQSKLANELTGYWKQYTDVGTSCTFNLGLHDNGDIRMSKPVKCDAKEAFNKMMSEISITTLSEKELKTLPSGIQMSIHHK